MNLLNVEAVKKLYDQYLKLVEEFDNTQRTIEEKILETNPSSFNDLD